MTDDEIDKLEGRALDVAMAERVMGWEWRDLGGMLVLIEPSADHLLRAGVVMEPGKPPYLNDNLPRYSADWAAAGLVVDYLMLDGWRFECGIEDEPFYAIFTKANKRAIAYAYRGAASEHIAVAICHAALRAVATQGK